jgi:hypothetical protein
MMKSKDQKGQALIELIIFLPLMFTVYAVISGFANAINGSINQQKVVRSYFYFRTQNNSMIPKPIEGFTQYQQFGADFLGWKEFFGGNEQPMAPCYKVSIPMKASGTDSCANRYSEPSSLYMRVGTAYGVCGGTFMNTSNNVVLLPDSPGMTYASVTSLQSCTSR